MSWCVALLLGLAVTAASVLYGGLYEPAFQLPSLLLLTVAGGFFAGGTLAGRFQIPWGAAQGALLLLATYVLLRAFALSPANGWAMVGNLAALGIIYFGAAWIATDPKAGGILVGTLVLTALGQIMAGTIGATEGRPHWPLPWLSETLRSWYADRSGERLHGFYLNANHLAWLLNLTGLMALAYALWARISAVAKITLALAALGMFGGSFLTLSRGGLLSLAAGLLSLALVSGWLIVFRVGRMRWPLLMMMLAAGMGIFFLLQTGLEQIPKYSVRFAIAENEGDYREEIWPIAWRQFQTEPTWGTGPGTFKYFARMYRQNPLGNDPVFAHNDWLEYLAEWGTVGFFLLLAGLALHFRALGIGLKRIATSPQFQEGLPQDSALAAQVGAFAALIAGAAHSFFDFNLHLPANLFLGTLFLGWIAQSPPKSSVSAEVTSWHRLAGVATGLLLTAILMLTLSRNGPAALRQLQAENAHANNRLPESTSLIQSALECQPQSAAAWSLLGWVKREHGNQQLFPEVRRAAYLSAANAFGEAMKREPLEASHYLNRSDSLLRAGLPSEAKQLAAQAIALDPLQLSPYPYAALAVANEGHLEASRRFYSLALRLPGPKAFTQDQIRRLPVTVSPPPQK